MKHPGNGLANAIEIVEEDGVRVLQIGGNAIPSAMRLGAPRRIELDYGRAKMAFLLFLPYPRGLPLGGLGGGSIGGFIHHRRPQKTPSLVATCSRLGSAG